MNTKELTTKANRVAGALSGIGIALECLAILVGIVLIIAGLAATDTNLYGESAPNASLIIFGFAALLSTVWIYALFGFLEYVLRLQVAQVVATYGNETDDFDRHVATAPIEAPAHRYCGAADKHEPHDYEDWNGVRNAPYHCGGIGIRHLTP